MTPAKSIQAFIAFLLLLLVTLVIWHKSGDFSYLLSPRVNSVEVPCSLETLTCTISTAQGDVQLSVDAEIRPLTPFVFSIHSENNFIKNARIHFEGYEDYMGLNNFAFVPSSSNNDFDQFTAHGSIPVCTTASKTWRVTINLQNQHNTESYWFKLQVL